MKRSSARRRLALGFTLVELMVAFTAGTFAVTGAYYLGSISSRNFNEQMRLSETQMSLRMAMGQVRRDFARAGYFASRNSNFLSNCSGGLGGPDVNGSIAGPIQSVNMEINGSIAATRPGGLGPATEAQIRTALNNTRADLVTLTGNYATTEGYLQLNTPGLPLNQVQLSPTRGAFQRSFFTLPPAGPPAVYNPVAFREAFRMNRWVRVESNGRFFFRRIAANPVAGDGTMANPPTLTLDQVLPACYDPASAIVAPVAMIQYRLDPIDGTPVTPVELRQLNPQTVSLGAARAALVRRELNLGDGSEVAQASSVVLDNVVELQVNAIVDTTLPGPAAVPAFTFVDSTTPVTVQQAATLNPEQLRTLIVTLSVRTPEAERIPRLFNRALLRDPLLTFRSDNNPLSANFFVSRVRTLRSEIFLANSVNP